MFEIIREVFEKNKSDQSKSPQERLLEIMEDVEKKSTLDFHLSASRMEDSIEDRGGLFE